MELVISQERLADTFAALVAIDSPSRGERAMADGLTGRLEALGLTVTEDGAGEKIGGSSGNLYGFLPARWTSLPCCCAPTWTQWPPGRASGPCGRQTAPSTVPGTRCWAPTIWRRWPSFWRCSPPWEKAACPTGPLRCSFPPRRRRTARAPRCLTFPGCAPGRPMCWITRGLWGRAVVAAPTILGFTAAVTGRASHAGFAPEAGVSALLTAARPSRPSQRTGGAGHHLKLRTGGGRQRHQHRAPDVRCPGRDPQHGPRPRPGPGGSGALGL